eukprot:COSAG01_NODE_241_length_20597_cov_8.200751_4_plen_84_part_00
MLAIHQRLSTVSTLTARQSHHCFGQVIVYVKSAKVWTPAAIEDLVKEGLVVAVKYAIVRTSPDEDAFLSELCQRIGPKMIISG